MVNERILARIRIHAQENPQQEVCGIVVSSGDNYRVIRAANISSKPHLTFVIDPEAYIEAEKSGTIVAFYHSHPRTKANASDPDKTACEASKKKWIIYSVWEDKFEIIEPTGQCTPLKGRSFLWGVHDCYTLVRDYYKTVLDIEFPEAEPYEQKFWDNGRNYYIERYVQFGFDKVSDLCDVRLHDVLLIQLQAKIPNHAAIYIGKNLILHHVVRQLSTETMYGGYWRENTNFVLRHKSLC